MKFQITKSPIPIIWLDSSVFINLKDIKQGKKLVAGFERYSKVHELVLFKVREGKAICPSGDQDEEFEFGNDAKDCCFIQDSLSHGIHFFYRSRIQVKQTVRFARLYVDGGDQIVLSYEEAFEQDPIQQLKDTGLIVSVHLPLPDELIKKFKHDQQQQVVMTENLRLDNLKQGITFQEQLAKEYDAMIVVVQVVAQNWNTIIGGKKTPTLDDYFQLQAVEPFNRVLEISKSLQSTIDFFTSDIYKSMPYIDISRKLYAERVTSTTPIESGDYMDIEQIATLMPYCDLLVTDRKMKNRIKKLGFDSKYRTKVYSMSDFDQLVGDIEML